MRLLLMSSKTDTLSKFAAAFYKKVNDGNRKQMLATSQDIASAVSRRRTASPAASKHGTTPCHSRAVPDPYLGGYFSSLILTRYLVLVGALRMISVLASALPLAAELGMPGTGARP